MSLDTKLCFKIYSASRTLIRLYKPILDKLDLTFPQYIVMSAMWEHKRILFRDLGNILMFETGTLTPILQKLEKAGYIKRERDTEDERKVYIQLMEKGIELEEKSKCVPEEILTAIGITKEEYMDFLKSTSNLFEILNNAEKRY